MRFISGASLKCSKDYIKDDNAFLANIALTVAPESGIPLKSGDTLRLLQPNTRLINITSDFANIFTLSHNHSIGIGFIGGEDNVLLGDISFEFNIFPLSGLMFKSIKQPELFHLKWGIDARTELIGQTDRDLNTFQSLSAGINYKFNEYSSAGIAYSWQDGANPYTGLDNQEFISMNINLRLVVQ